MTLTLIVGGARSGKSALAVEHGRRFGGQVTFIATAPASDADMRERIARHRAERPATWATVEAPMELEAALDAAGPGLVIIDCLTLWTSNLMERELADESIVELSSSAARAAAERADPVLAVTNEVGLGVHPGTELGRRYRDVQGWVNQRWASAASASVMLIAGRAIRLEDASDVLHDAGLQR